MAMTKIEIDQILDRYEIMLTAAIAEAQAALSLPRNHMRRHTHLLDVMIPTMRVMNDEEAAPKEREKLMRWLGFMQGAMWDMGYYTIDELKNHNRGYLAVSEVEDAGE